MSERPGPRNGDYGLTQIQGFLGFLVALGMLLIGDASRFTHAFWIIDAEAGIAVEARPGGAIYVKYREEYADRLVAYSHLDLTDEQRARVPEVAKGLLGAGYNYLDYLALAFLRWGIRFAWLTRFVADKGRFICSQLVDEGLRRIDVHLFDDGRLSQDVSPGDLLYVGNVY